MGERPTPDAPHRGKRRPPPPDTLMLPPQRGTPAGKSARGGVGDGSPGPHSPHRQPVPSGPQPHAREDERLGVGERPTPGAPHPGKRRPPPGALVPPRQRAKSARKSARCGVGDRSSCPHPPHPEPVGSGPRPHALKGQVVGAGRAPNPGSPGKRRPPGHPCATPTARKASSQECVLWGW